MHWLEKWRKAHQMSRETLGKQVECSERLIEYAEIGYPIHPYFADAIADYTGATARQRDSLVHKKHRGTYIPKKKRQEMPLAAAKTAVKRELKRLPRREVVAVNRAGEEVGRYPTIVAAADAYEPCVQPTVANRCARKLSPSANEFLPYGVTFRYADEWDFMTELQRAEDMERAEGSGKPHGRQHRRAMKNEYA